MDYLNNLGFNNPRLCFNPGFDLEIHCSSRTLDNRWIIESRIDLGFDLRFQ